MCKIINLKIVFTGLALFSMFFGAGNIIFPLAVGQYAGDKNLFAIMGLTITAVLVPFLGVLAMILYDGNLQSFFGRIGKVPGFWLAFLIIALLGPLGSSPRCIALSYSTLKAVYPGLNLIFFSALSCFVIYLFTFRKNKILGLLGYVLTPILLTSLVIVIIKGLFYHTDIQNLTHAPFSIFLFGLREGYNTMDLLAAFFFSSSVLASLKKGTVEGEGTSVLRLALQASIFGAFLLALIYIGFSYLASLHPAQIQGNDELLMAITMKIMGPSAGFFVSFTIALACLTTAIALLSVFAEFFQKQVLEDKISYQTSLIFSLVVTFFISTFEFSGIAQFLSPILQVCYPMLIVLTILNIAYRLGNFKPIKIPVLAVFILSIVNYMYS